MWLVFSKTRLMSDALTLRLLSNAARTRDTIEGALVAHPEKLAQFKEVSRNFSALRFGEEALRHIASNLMVPLCSNVIAHPTEAKFGSVSSTQVLVLVLQSYSGGAEWMRLAGFQPNASGTRLERGPDADSPQQALHIAQEVLLKTEPSPPALLLPSKSSKIEAEKAARVQTILASFSRDREETVPTVPVQRPIRSLIGVDNPLHDTARRTVHGHGRLRNSFFESHDVRIATMQTGRWFYCADCPPEGIEVHWHLRVANHLYAFTAHLNPAGTAVVHVGPELGYQLNTIPQTPGFGGVELTSRKVTDDSGAQLLKHEICHTPASECQYCAAPLLPLLQ